jgi:hypothetical protein
MHSASVSYIAPEDHWVSSEKEGGGDGAMFLVPLCPF